MNTYNLYMRTTLSEDDRLFSFECLGCVKTDLSLDLFNKIILKVDENSHSTIQYFVSECEILSGVHYV